MKLNFKAVFFFTCQSEKIKWGEHEHFTAFMARNMWKPPKHIKAQFVSSSKAKYTGIFDVPMPQIFNFMKSTPTSNCIQLR